MLQKQYIFPIPPLCQSSGTLVFRELCLLLQTCSLKVIRYYCNRSLFEELLSPISLSRALFLLQTQCMKITSAQTSIFIVCRGIFKQSPIKKHFHCCSALANVFPLFMLCPTFAWQLSVAANKLFIGPRTSLPYFHAISISLHDGWIKQLGPRNSLSDISHSL